MPIGKRMAGYTLIELLVSLLLTSFLGLMVAQYLLTSQQVHRQLQQDALAARLAMDLAAQFQSATFSSTDLSSALRPGNCPSTRQQLPDLQLWCQALNQLPDLQASIQPQGQALRLLLQWQSGERQRQLQRWLSL